MSANITRPTGSGLAGATTTKLKSFFETNSLVAKVAFILLILLVFIVVLRLCIGVLSYMFDASGTPKLFTGMVPGNFAMTFDQGGTNDATTIIRSNNQYGGIEFTWSTWVFLETDANATTYRHIFSKGNANEYASNYPKWDSKPKKTGIMFPNNAPGLYVAPNDNKLLLVMNTFSKIDEEVSIDNMPMNKWVSIIIRVKDKNLDIFTNGIITKNMQFSSPPRQNYEKVNLHLNGGYNGYTSNLWYYNYALGINAINSIMYWGPNTKLAVNGSIMETSSNYLSSSWYFDSN
jgi:hypothetical protein